MYTDSSISLLWAYLRDRRHSSREVEGPECTGRILFYSVWPLCGARRPNWSPNEHRGIWPLLINAPIFQTQGVVRRPRLPRKSDGNSLFDINAEVQPPELSKTLCNLWNAKASFWYEENMLVSSAYTAKTVPASGAYRQRQRLEPPHRTHSLLVTHGSGTIRLPSPRLPPPCYYRGVLGPHSPEIFSPSAGRKLLPCWPQNRRPPPDDKSEGSCGPYLPAITYDAPQWAILRHEIHDCVVPFDVFKFIYFAPGLFSHGIGSSKIDETGRNCLRY